MAITTMNSSGRRALAVLGLLSAILVLLPVNAAAQSSADQYVPRVEPAPSGPGGSDADAPTTLLQEAVREAKEKELAVAPGGGDSGGGDVPGTGFPLTSFAWILGAVVLAGLAARALVPVMRGQASIRER